MMEPLGDGAVRVSFEPSLALAAFEAATQGLLVLTPDGHVLAANRAFGLLYGIEIGDIVGHHYTVFANDLEVRQHDGFVGPESWVTSRALKGERVEPLVQSIRNRRSRREFIARCGAVPTFENGRLVAATITVEDVTDAVRDQRTVGAALSTAEVATYRIDLLERRVYGDGNFARVYGLPEEAARGGPVSSVYDTVHPEDLPRVQAAIREATASGEPHELEYRVFLPDGEVRWLLSRGRAELDAQGSPIQRIGSVMDITRRKIAEEALRAQTARYEAVIESERRLSEADDDYVTLSAHAVREAQLLTSADGACLEIQDHGMMVYEAACGIAEGFVGLRLPASGSLSGKSVESGTSAWCDDSETDERVDREACRKIGLRSMALVPLRYDQRSFGVLKVMAARPFAFGSAETQTLDLLGGFLGAAIGRARAARALAESEARLRAIFDALPALIFHIDADLRYRFVNQRFREWFGKGPEEAVGKTVREEVGEATFSIVEPYLRKALAGEKTQWESWVDFPTGRRYVLTMYVPTSDVHGKIVGFDVLSSDLTEVRLAQEAVANANETLETRVRERTDELIRANRDLDQFAYSVAHDLRAPLRSIVSTSRMLLEDAEGRLHLDEANLLRRQAASGVRLAKIVDDLLGFARLAQAEPKRVAFDMTSLARATADQVRAIRGSACQIDVQDGMKALGDPNLIGYVLTNLLDNACKFSPGGGQVTVSESNGAFFVRDQGMGFDMAHAQKLFVAFERLVDQSVEGTGVGLANVRRIVEKHGGSVGAESEPGMGATFWFTLGQDETGGGGFGWAALARNP